MGKSSRANLSGVLKSNQLGVIESGCESERLY